ncbi:MAG: HU-CCDC81 and SPOR domain-containing protein [Bacteroidia bacterium]|nr:HU-CCDC81 and SPOR domain-containing protein [Bacteroidia bacterium]
MDITAFIRELLFGHDCVIVPGFGGFIGNYTPAQVDRNTDTFYPPVKQISFNRNLNHNDGLLVGRISSTLNVNYGDARTITEKFVTDLRRKLENGERVVFENIGSFINNHEGNVQFEPDRSVNYHLDSYGLESFQCLPLEGYDVRKRIVKHKEKDTVRHISTRKILWRAAVIIPLLSVIVAVPLMTDIFKPKVEASTMNPLVTEEFEHNRAAVDNTEKPAVDISPEISAKANEVVPAKVSEENIVAAPVGRYQLITGSFRSRENAQKQADMLMEEGFSPEIISSANGFFRVSAITCKDIQAAESKKDSLAGKFPEAWIIRKR